ncbi:MAG TPA: hypothetical protein VM681_03700, partial [Candidatus Thermoplasmatota archaeon]|nr:hypothetical protein [Candidatus Thermoplasmatota archaeon]
MAAGWAGSLGNLNEAAQNVRDAACALARADPFHDCPAWTHRYDGPAGLSDGAFRMKLAPDGSTLYVAGTSTTRASSDFLTMALDPQSGLSRWIATYDGPGNHLDLAIAIDVSTDGSRVFVGGW